MQPEAEIATSTAPSEDPPRRHRGKIASLPKEHRDTINRLLADGTTYAEVVAHMAVHQADLNIQNVANWYQSGFQDYLAQLERVDFLRARYESASSLLQETDTSKLPQAGLQTAAAQIYDLLGRFTPALLSQNTGDDPDKYTRIVNALSRLARETLALQKYSDACAKARAAIRELKDPNRKLTESETHAIIRHVDEILGLGPKPLHPQAVQADTSSVAPVPTQEPNYPGAPNSFGLACNPATNGPPDAPAPAEASSAPASEPPGEPAPTDLSQVPYF